MKIKEIFFKNEQTQNEYFDYVTLEDIFAKKPKRHSQFDHHKINFFVIVLITKGKGKHSINYIDYNYKKGTVFTLRKNAVHKFYRSAAEGIFLVFTENFIIKGTDDEEPLKLFQLFNEMLGSPKIQLSDEQQEEIGILTQQIKKDYLERYDVHTTEIVRALSSVLISKLFRYKANRGDHVGQAKYHLLFTQLQYLVEQDCFTSRKAMYYSKKMGVSSRTLSNVTQRTIGKPVKAFINDIFTLQIKRLIVNSSQSLTEIAYQTGFDDPTNFFKYFRKHTGLSPKQFKEKCK